MKYAEIIWKYQISNEKIDEKNENSNECCSKENSEATKFKKTRQRKKDRVKTLIFHIGQKIQKPNDNKNSIGWNIVINCVHNGKNTRTQQNSKNRSLYVGVI